jgi:hypothetical protein
MFRVPFTPIISSTGNCSRRPLVQALCRDRLDGVASNPLKLRDFCLKIVARDAVFALLSIVRTCVCIVSLRILSGPEWKGEDWELAASDFQIIPRRERCVQGVVELQSLELSLTVNNTAISYIRFSLLSLS